MAIKPAVHHWWPRTLAEHWRDTDGLVSTIRPSGIVSRDPPGAYGGIKNAHHIRIGGPWDATFEPVFDTADTQMREIISWLLTLEASHADPYGPMLQRIRAQPLLDDRQHQLARTVASLVARSPRTRSEIRLTTEHFRKQFGMADPRPEKHLIAMNQRGLYDAYCDVMARRGRWAVLFSDSKEFIFGDGFLHNFPASRDGLHARRKCVLPLTPTITVVYMLPMSYPSEPKLVTIRLSDEEVEFFDDAVQVYAKEFLFFRSQRPKLISPFTDASHREFKYHQHEWLEGFLDWLSQYNLWGESGSPSRGKGDFLESFQGNVWLKSFLDEDTATN